MTGPSPISALAGSAVDHVGIAVPDLDAAIALYTEVLGGVLAHREQNSDQGVEEAMIAFADGGAQIQLLAPLTPASPIATFIDKHGPGLQQLAVRVADVDQACAQLRQQGFRVLYDAPRRGTAGSRINFVHPRAVGGVLLELVEPAPASSHRQAGSSHNAETD